MNLVRSILENKFDPMVYNFTAFPVKLILIKTFCVSLSVLSTIQCTISVTRSTEQIEYLRLTFLNPISPLKSDALGYVGSGSLIT